MTTIKTKTGETPVQQYAERLQRCADLGQIVPIDKARCRAHYEAMAAQQQQEAGINVNA
jgi:hypothetical protein